MDPGEHIEPLSVQWFLAEVELRVSAVDGLKDEQLGCLMMPMELAHHSDLVFKETLLSKHANSVPMERPALAGLESFAVVRDGALGEFSLAMRELTLFLELAVATLDPVHAQLFAKVFCLSVVLNTQTV